MQALDQLRQFVTKYYSRWLDRRIPAAQSIKLTHRQLFIVPSKAGFGFLLLIALLWLLATNYENNPVFVLCFLMVALFIVAIYFTHGNLSGITIRQVKAESVFSGQNAAVTIALSQPNNKTRDAVVLYFTDSEPIVVSLHEQGDSFVSLLLPASKRGYLKTGRLTIESCYPFGLFRVWTFVQLKFNAVVYPKPIEGIPQATGSANSSEGQLSNEDGADDYVGLKRYQPGDSLRHVAWKHYAREQGMWSKHYADSIDQQLLIDWAAFPGMHREQRLSHMCWLVRQYSANGYSYGLRLPGVEMPASSGVNHANTMLRHLALFEVPGVEHQYAA